jgi:uncharacterized radical SAM superfamily protein
MRCVPTLTPQCVLPVAGAKLAPSPPPHADKAITITKTSTWHQFSRARRVSKAKKGGNPKKVAQINVQNRPKRQQLGWR